MQLFKLDDSFKQQQPVLLEFCDDGGESQNNVAGAERQCSD